MKTRIEKDSLGERKIPHQAYYGVQTLRASENFPVSGLRAHPSLIWTYACLKKACAQANQESGALKPWLARAIVKACDAVLIARYRALNSGNVYLGMTFGKALIGPNEGNTGEILSLTDNLLFDAGDLASLQAVLDRALVADLKPLGTRNAEWLKANARWELIAESLLEAVRALPKY